MAGAMVIFLLSAYRRMVSPCLPRACRFYPPCSVYMQEAIRRYGLFRGTASGLSRVGRCHPWHPGGYDPIK